MLFSQKKLNFEHVAFDWIGDRSIQQDALKLEKIEVGSQPTVFCAISDGVGGASGSEVASKFLVNTCLSETKRLDTLDNLTPATLIRRANESLKHEKSIGNCPPDAAATLVLVLFTSSYCRWASVGDSKLFRYRQKKLKLLNDQHSKKAELQALVKNGLLHQDDIEFGPSAHQLTSWISGDDISKMSRSVKAVRLKRGDKFLLASDGIDVLSKFEVEQSLKEIGSTENFIRDAIHAKDSGNRDNLAVIGVSVI